MPPSSGPSQNRLAQAAVEYARYGWSVVLLHSITGKGDCTCGNKCELKSRGKHPRLKDWGNEATNDEEKLLALFDDYPLSNVGILMGPVSGIVDFETDGEEGETLLLRMFGGEIPVTPTFTSGRGKHRLFRWRDDLPRKGSIPLGVADVKLGADGKASQSVFPPSKHYTGKFYQWLVPPSEADLAEIPTSVVAWLVNRGIDEQGDEQERTPSIRHKLYSPGVIHEGEGRDNVLHAEAVALWREQFRMYGPKCFDSVESQTTVYQRLWAWNRAKFQPCFDDTLVLGKCTAASDFLRKETAKEKNGRGMNLSSLGLEWQDGEWFPGTWRVEVIRMDPRKVRLYAPFLPKGHIEMTMAEYDDPKAVHLAVLTETGTVCLNSSPGVWPSIWNGKCGSKKEGTPFTIGVKAKLLENAQWVSAPRDTSREFVVCEYVIDYFDQAHVLNEGDSPDERGYPSRDLEGGIWFKFKRMFAQLSRVEDQITRNELSDVLAKYGAQDKNIRVAGRQVRFKYLSLDGIRKLESDVFGPIRENDSNGEISRETEKRKSALFA